MKELELEHLSGPLKGRKSRFEAKRLRITIGRDENCDIVFPGEALQVGSEHLELVRDAGYYELRTNTQDAVCVNGRTGLDGQELEEGDVIELGGTGGPKLTVHYTGAATEKSAPRKGKRARRSADDASLLRGTRRTQVILFGIVVLLVGWLVALYWNARTDRAQLNDSIELLSSEFGSRQSPKFDAAIAATSPSVYLVLSKSDKIGESPVGTAWVVGDHLLATNAHVAAQFLRVSMQGRQFIARSTTPPYADIKIVEVGIHPAYAEFAKIWDDYSPRVFNEEGKDVPLTSPGAYDVALLLVEEGATLAAPLRLADDATLAALKAGDPVAYVGFPMENLVQLDLHAPNPVSQTSSIVGLVTFTLVKPTDGSGQLIEHSLPGIGGASGSPIFNSNGEVVGLFSSINVVSSLFGDSRIANPVQINFAQRVDVLKQILQEPLVIDMEALRAQWTHELENYKSRRSATEIIVSNALDLWARKFGQNTVPGQVKKESLAIDGTSWVGEWPAASLTFEAAPGHYFVVAVSPTYRDIDLAATRYDAGTAVSLANDDALEHYPMVSFDINQAGPVSIFVIDKKLKLGFAAAGSNAEVSIYQVPTDAPQGDRFFDEWFTKLSGWKSDPK